MVSCEGGVWVFRVYCPDAERVYLVGDFNDWSGTAWRMQSTEPGFFELRLPLPPGEYRFRYRAWPARLRPLRDGEPEPQPWWVTDWAAFGVRPNRAGSWDSVLFVPWEGLDRSPRVVHHRVNRAAAAAGDHGSDDGAEWVAEATDDAGVGRFHAS